MNEKVSYIMNQAQRRSIGITSKISKIFDDIGHNKTINRMKRDRQAARVANLITDKLNNSVEILKADMAEYIHRAIKEELK